MTDSQHCGSGDRACAPTESCNAGACAPDSCAGIICGVSDPCHLPNFCDRSTAQCAPAGTAVVANVTSRSPAVGPSECVGTGMAPDCTRQRYTNPSNVASQRNGARAAVSSGSGSARPERQTSNVNDGFYGSGSSWDSSRTDGWVKIDLGRSIALERMTFGRDRTGALKRRWLRRAGRLHRGATRSPASRDRRPSAARRRSSDRATKTLRSDVLTSPADSSPQSRQRRGSFAPFVRWNAKCFGSRQ